VEGSRYSWKAAGTRGRQQELVRGSRNSWEVAGTRGSQQIPSGEDNAVLISVGALKLGT
jgi:hypothetical protein